MRLGSSIPSSTSQFIVMRGAYALICSNTMAYKPSTYPIKKIILRSHFNADITITAYLEYSTNVI